MVVRTGRGSGGWSSRRVEESIEGLRGKLGLLGLRLLRLERLVESRRLSLPGPSGSSSMTRILSSLRYRSNELSESVGNEETRVVMVTGGWCGSEKWMEGRRDGVYGTERTAESERLTDKNQSEEQEEPITAGTHLASVCNNYVDLKKPIAKTHL